LRVVTFWTMRLSVILLPQSWGFDDGVLCFRVLYGVVVSADGAADGCLFWIPLFLGRIQRL